MDKLDFKTALNWRYATKRMNRGKVPETELGEILDAIQFAPTSRGLQPFKVIIIDDPEIKEKILSVADNQPQVVESSHLLVFAAWSEVTYKQINEFIQFAASERGVPVEMLDKMKSVLVRDQLSMDSDGFYHWASKQIYIALGFALIAAAVNKIDAAAMEGFDKTALDKLLNLEKQGLKSTVLLALGYRDAENDWLSKLKKVRRTHSELFIFS